MATSEQLKEFTDDLKILLDKHDASIGFTCDSCSDLHGLYDEAISVSFSDNINIQLAYGYWIDTSDF